MSVNRKTSAHSNLAPVVVKRRRLNVEAAPAVPGTNSSAPPPVPQRRGATGAGSLYGTVGRNTVLPPAAYNAGGAGGTLRRAPAGYPGTTSEGPDTADAFAAFMKDMKDMGAV